MSNKLKGKSLRKALTLAYREIIRDGNILLSDGVIASICRTSEETADAETVIDGRGLAAVPGYIDVHCHGGGGYDCNQGTEEAVVKIRSLLTIRLALHKLAALQAACFLSFP